LRFTVLGQSSFIPRFFTGIFFLLLFTLSITPKRFLHDALANHTDSARSQSGDVQEVYASGFQCHADELVVDAPFIPEPAALYSHVTLFSSFDYASPLFPEISHSLLVSTVRGPPVPAVS